MKTAVCDATEDCKTPFFPLFVELQELNNCLQKGCEGSGTGNISSVRCLIWSSICLLWLRANQDNSTIIGQILMRINPNTFIKESKIGTLEKTCLLSHTGIAAPWIAISVGQCTISVQTECQQLLYYRNTEPYPL